MQHSFRTHRPPKSPPADERLRHILAIGVLALFVAVCLGRLLAPQVALFGELLPVASGLLVVVVRYYFAGRGRA